MENDNLLRDTVAQIIGSDSLTAIEKEAESVGETEVAGQRSRWSRAYTACIYESPAEVAANPEEDLTRSELARMMAEGELVGKPMLVNHEDDLHVGRIAEMVMTKEGSAFVKFHLDLNTYPGKWAYHCVKTKKMPSVSLSHWSSSKRAREVSLCIEGARPRTRIINASKDKMEAPSSFTHTVLQDPNASSTGKMHPPNPQVDAAIRDVEQHHRETMQQLQQRKEAMEAQLKAQQQQQQPAAMNVDEKTVAPVPPPSTADETKEKKKDKKDKKKKKSQESDDDDSSGDSSYEDDDDEDDDDDDDDDDDSSAESSSEEEKSSKKTKGKSKHKSKSKKKTAARLRRLEEKLEQNDKARRAVETQKRAMEQFSEKLKESLTEKQYRKISDEVSRLRRQVAEAGHRIDIPVNASKDKKKKDKSSKNKSKGKTKTKAKSKSKKRQKEVSEDEETDHKSDESDDDDDDSGHRKKSKHQTPGAPSASTTAAMNTERQKQEEQMQLLQSQVADLAKRMALQSTPSAHDPSTMTSTSAPSSTSSSSSAPPPQGKLVNAAMDIPMAKMLAVLDQIAPNVGNMVYHSGDKRVPLWVPDRK